MHKEMGTAPSQRMKGLLSKLAEGSEVRSGGGTGEKV
jgi:hypothetical protein